MKLYVLQRISCFDNQETGKKIFCDSKNEKAFIKTKNNNYDSRIFEMTKSEV